MDIDIREETPGDVAAVEALTVDAFGQRQEANIIAALRQNGGVILSLVATRDGVVVGHILYSQATLAGDLAGAALGPMAVSPQFQHQGIGSLLIRAGNERLRQEGVPYIIVLGHAEYYPRFGFMPASRYGVTCQWQVPSDVFMMLVLDEARLQGVSGEAQYRVEFSTVA